MDYGRPKPVDYGRPKPVDCGRPKPVDYGRQRIRSPNERSLYGFTMLQVNQGLVMQCLEWLHACPSSLHLSHHHLSSVTQDVTVSAAITSINEAGLLY